MALSAKLRKSINAAYDALMFEKVDSRRIKEIDDDWVALSDFRVKHFDEKISIDVDIGLFSRRINEISNWFPPNILPGLIQCHFFSSVFELNEGKWKPEVSSTLFVPLDGDDQATAKFVKESIINNIPKAIDRYANWEAVVENRRLKIGGNGRHSNLSLHAGAALVLLNRLDEVSAEMESVIKAGTLDGPRKIHENILNAARLSASGLSR